MKTWPYKLEPDNLFRAATEMHVFIVIITALVLKNDLRWEFWGPAVYDYTLFFSFVLLVPTAWVMTIAAKMRHLQHVIGNTNRTTELEKRKFRFTPAFGTLVHACSGSCQF